LEKNPNVEYAEPDYILTADIIPNDSSFNQLYGLHDVGDSSPDNDINGPEAWDIFTGSADLVIAIIDSGVDYNHPDLNNNMWVNPDEIPSDGIDNDGNGYVDDIYGYDFCNNDPNPFDDNSHGTHVAGTVCSEGNNNQGVVGVNWQCKLMALKFLCSNGGGSTSDAISAIQYANDKGVKISSNSWGGSGFSQAMNDAIQNAGLSNGHIFVAAAGNSNQNTDSSPHYPSSYNLDNIISVASITDSGAKSSFSSYGANTVDIGAPGSSIYSTTPGNNYSFKSGTSMATPHVAGVVALVYGYLSQIDPNVSSQTVIQTIYDNVKPLSSLNGITVTGGIVDAFASLTALPIDPQCNDDMDNDEDGATDYPDDPDCLNENDNDESPDVCCLVAPPPPPVGGECSGECGGQAPSGCWCDNQCQQFGDCCGGPDAACIDCSSLSFCESLPPPPPPPPVEEGECILTSQINCAQENNLGVPTQGTCEASLPVCTGLSLQCSDGIDNDTDGAIDLADAGCINSDDDDESDGPQQECSDGIDNDGDTAIDFPDDLGCSSIGDNLESDGTQQPQCSDGIDNDTDGAIDLADAGCINSDDDDESDGPQQECSDGIDNDGDTAIDFPDDLGCSSIGDNLESDGTQQPQCSDGIDNDGDGLIDLLDPGCANSDDDDESDDDPPPPPPPGGECSGECGGQAPSGCWCDNLCQQFGDCCGGAGAACVDCPTLNFCN